MALNKDVVDRSRSRSAPAPLSSARAGKVLLLIVEVAAVIGLLIGAYQLWQVRQSLAEDLATAQKVEAMIEDGDETVPQAAPAADNSPGTGSIETLPPPIIHTLDSPGGDLNVHQQHSGRSATRGRR